MHHGKDMVKYRKWLVKPSVGLTNKILHPGISYNDQSDRPPFTDTGTLVEIALQLTY